jgi:hypothetical protein
MIAQGLDPALFKEGVRYALVQKIVDAADRVNGAVRDMHPVPSRGHAVDVIIERARLLRPDVDVLVSALDNLDAVIADCEEVWAAIERPETVIPGGA